MIAPNKECLKVTMHEFEENVEVIFARKNCELLPYILEDDGKHFFTSTDFDQMFSQ